ncbi:hypothetical protein [Hamadaea tsunoensis]|uniref:hypothetical protein n=1 Tax=Hamadaea tsunoensis TaxID=53368 RepID=UPI0003F94D39|nr:hypothetical protein [Hamadaea tsunoensis]
MAAQRLARGVAAVVLGLSLAGGTLAACSGEGASANCDKADKSCTVTFDRKADTSQIKILGVTVKLVSVDNESVSLSVGDRNVTIDKGSTKTIGDFSVSLDQVTADQIVVKVARS